MFARSMIRRQTYEEVMAKTAANTVGATAPGSLQSVGAFFCFVGVACCGFYLNKSTPSTQLISPYYNRMYGTAERRNW
eukprot:CAMPEP_0176437172 /NCGR_PEP_ID=MMETSP0127-20121128/18447_1 /TAXON_ID=938130 /ORGANISM="Platyophrya macrostoma, Strain WH" /LENGTH=77 /DNA_ID=CAMNT_0017820715 /DNA_START=58 /DNA_END=291 /DNA_ORIENTATION=-